MPRYRLSEDKHIVRESPINKFSKRVFFAVFQSFLNGNPEFSMK